ncbi:MAG: dehydrogenase E1 component subunit alpha/beta [Actinobacteria bacterium]|nr:dehydrogenase E1 component subunit alpha/beta [Actinomycetota bacterium]
MRRIRTFEEWVSRLYAGGDVPGFCHVSVGQESVPVGVCSALTTEDIITSTHRGHGHVMAKGTPAREMFAELMGKSTGVCGGLGGSMHIADPRIGVFGANGVVGAGIPIAVGAAHAARYRDAGFVVTCFFGDGAVAGGAFHEGVNLAALWNLPVLFVCENNLYAEFTWWERQHPVPPAERAAAYGLKGHRIDGRDVAEVADLAGELVDQLRSGGPPVLLEVTVHRWEGHYVGDPADYRLEGEREAMRAEDPLAHARERLEDDEADTIDREVEEEMRTAVETARADPVPDIADLGRYVYAPRPLIDEEDIDDDVSDFRYIDGVIAGLGDAMVDDDRVFLAGVDVGAVGGIFRATRGLFDQFGADRVIDTPISETAVVGLAVGSAMAGLRPVIEIMFIDFIGVCFDQIINQAAKLRFMTGGAVDLSLVIRTQYGAGRSAGAQHSQSLEALLAAVPGLSVVMPSTGTDAYGLLRSAIEDPNPVVFIEHRHLYGWRGPKPGSAHRVPLGKANVVREGRDVTLVTSGRLLHQSLDAANELADEGIDIEVIDLRSLVPLDVETIASSVRKTTRLAVAHEAPAPFGMGAEIIQATLEQAFWRMDAPPLRIAPPPVPAPYAPNLERAWLPGKERIVEELRRLRRMA